MPPPDFMDSFASLLQPAEFDQCLASRFIDWHAGSDVLLHLRANVKREFLAHICLVPLALEKPTNWFKQQHSQSPGLLVTQSDQRIDARGATRWHKTGNQTDQQQKY